MDLKVFRDTLSAAGSFCTVQAEVPLETEILISDYLPQVFKIVKCFVKMVVLQKQFHQGRLTLDGYLRCIVYYQGEEGAGLCQVEQKIPFNKVMETPQFEFSTWSAAVGGETEYLNCRAVNQRRIEVRGAYAIAANVFTQVQQEIVTAVADCGVQQKQELLTGIKNIASIDKLIASENEFSFRSKPRTVLDMSGDGIVKEIKLIAGKAVVKGEMNITMVYREDESAQLVNQEIVLPFQQILDIEGIAEDCDCFCTVEPVGFTLLSMGDGTEQPQVSASALLHLRAYREYELNSVVDLFSTEVETELEQTPMLTETVSKALDEVVNGTANMQLPDESSIVVASFANFGMPEILPHGERAVLSIKGTVTVFSENGLGELESYDKSMELSFPLQNLQVEQTHLESWVSVEQVDCTAIKGQVEISVSARVRGILLGRNLLKGVSQVTLGEPLCPQDPEISLRIYYASAGEGVFEIARRFHVSPSEMIRVNGIDTQILSSARRLLVPEVG